MSLLHRPFATPKKRYSQNFLIDKNIVEKLIQYSHVTKNDSILEIGPGLGAITEKLLEKGADVYGIEKDRDLCEKLQNLSCEKFHLFCADALDFSYQNLPSPLKVVANLPFQITTPLLEKILSLHPQITSLTVIVQKEVGKRMTALANTPDYSHLSLFLQAYSLPQYCFTINPTCFYPRPKVSSSIVHLSLHTFPFSFSEKEFFQLTRTAFNQKRKMLRSSLKGLYGQKNLERAFAQAKIAPTARPQSLSLEEFARLYKACNNCKNSK